MAGLWGCRKVRKNLDGIEGRGRCRSSSPLQQLEHYLFLGGHTGPLPTGRAARLVVLLLKGYWILEPVPSVWDVGTVLVECQNY